MSRYIKQCRFSRKKAYRKVDYSHSVDSVLKFCNEYLEARDVVCIDEVGFYVGDHGQYGQYGYSHVGTRLRVTGDPNSRS